MANETAAEKKERERLEDKARHERGGDLFVEPEGYTEAELERLGAGRDTSRDRTDKG